MLIKFIETVDDQLEELLKSDDIVCITDSETIARMFGDKRATGMVWVDTVEECIVVKKYNDNTLQYYGGFEYVDKDCRRELGDYVIYMGAMSERVSDAIGAAMEACEAD